MKNTIPGTVRATTQIELRSAFWAEHPELAGSRRVGRRHNDYNAEIRQAFCDWLDGLARDGQITEALAGRATL